MCRWSHSLLVSVHSAYSFLHLSLCEINYKLFLWRLKKITHFKSLSSACLFFFRGYSKHLLFIAEVPKASRICSHGNPKHKPCPQVNRLLNPEKGDKTAQENYFLSIIVVENNNYLALLIGSIRHYSSNEGNVEELCELGCRYVPPPNVTFTMWMHGSTDPASFLTSVNRAMGAHPPLKWTL